MIKIAICICTRKREMQLIKLLESIRGMVIPSGTVIALTIVENDTEAYSKDTVLKFKKSSGLDISYYLEARVGLTYARNRSVEEAKDCDFYCFMDDDQVVKDDFLVNLLECQAEFAADGVAPRCSPLFDKIVSPAVQKFHTRHVHPYGHIVNSTGTGGLLISKNYLAMIQGPFDIRFNFSGCEDIFLTSQISGLGGKIRYNPNAVIYEVIPDSRTTVSYIYKRSFGDSNAEYFLRSLGRESHFKLRSLIYLFIKLGYGLLTVIPLLLFGGQNSLNGIIKIAHALGGISFFFGKKNQFYKSN
jgi:succinoglycan biosynthesis protein ExoM